MMSNRSNSFALFYFRNILIYLGFTLSCAFWNELGKFNKKFD